MQKVPHGTVPREWFATTAEKDNWDVDAVPLVPGDKLHERNVAFAIVASYVWDGIGWFKFKEYDVTA